MDFGTFFPIAVILVTLILVSRGIRVVHQAQTIVIERLAQTTLRNVIGEMDLDQTLGSRDVINSKLRAILDEATNKWGVKVNRVELQDISPPRDIKDAMEKQMRAERDRRATILTAEADKQSKILEAEGTKQAAINKAEGDKQARILGAEAEASARLRSEEHTSELQSPYDLVCR